MSLVRPLAVARPLSLATVLALASLALASLAGCVTADPPAFRTTVERDHPLAGRIWSGAENRFLSRAEVEATAQRADVVLLGETHDNPDHHALQAWMVGRLAKAGRRPAAAFEMMDTDQQAAVDAHLAAHPGDTDGLGAVVGWEKKGWPSWSLYEPIAEAVLAAGQPVKAANLPLALTRQIGKGTAPAEDTERLGVAVDPEPPTAAAMSAEIREAHCNMLPEGSIGAMVRIQRARDAEMAGVVAAALARPGGGTVALIAGAGHARTDRGVPARLKVVAPAASTYSVAFLEVEKGETDPAAYAQHFGVKAMPFDAVWFTPRTEREDPCEGFKKHMERKEAAKAKEEAAKP